MPPMSIETLALAVCGGLFHLTTPVLVMRVPIARPAAIVALKRRTTVSPGSRLPYVAP